MWNKGMTILCAYSAAVLFLTGCARQSYEPVSLKPSADETDNPMESELPESYTTTLPAKKEESVTVRADACGNPKSVSVEVSLSGMGEEGYVEDQTILTDLCNTKGTEEFHQLGDHRLLWDNLHETITYKGKTEEPLPAGVHIAYFLDGNAVSPEELAGKSGHVEMNITYENRTHSSIEADGRIYDLPVPFLAITLIPINDSFTNIKTENGRVITMADTRAVIGFAVPGLQDSLRLSDYEATKDLDLPESVRIEADVTDFRLGFTTTIFSSGLSEALEEEDLNEVNDLTDDMDRLSSASDELVDGTRKLYDGMREFQNYLVQYNDGIGRATDGINALKDGLKVMDEYSEPLNDGAYALSDGLNQLNAGLAGLDLSGLFPSEPSEEEKQFMNLVNAAREDIPVQAGILQDCLETLAEAEKEMQRFCREAEAYQAGITTALENIDALKSAAADAALTREEEAALRDVLISSGRSEEDAEALIAVYSSIPGELDSIQQSLSSESVRVPALDLSKVENAVTALTPAVQNLTQDLGILQQYITLVQTGIAQTEDLSAMITGLRSGVMALWAGSMQLKLGLSTYTDGLSDLYEGASQLSEGFGQLPEAGGKLMEGYASLTDGVWSLADGVRKFDEEGIKELTRLCGSQLQELIRRVRALRRIEDAYTSFSGIPEGVEGSVRFMIETEEIAAGQRPSGAVKTENSSQRNTPG